MACSHRIATRAVLPQIVEIDNSTMPFRCATVDTEPVTGESRLTWCEEHPPTFRPLWVVEVDQRLVGWLRFSSLYGRPASHKTAARSVSTHEAVRRRRLGADFLTQALAHAPSLQVDTLRGLIFAHNAPSVRLFETWGGRRWGT